MKNIEHSSHLVSEYSDKVLARMVASVSQVVNQYLQHWKQEGIIDKICNQI
jgi:hypothetical protein